MNDHEFTWRRVDASWAARILRANDFTADDISDDVLERGDAAGWVAYQYCCLDHAKADAELLYCQQQTRPPLCLQIIEGGVVGLYHLPFGVLRWYG